MGRVGWYRHYKVLIVYKRKHKKKKIVESHFNTLLHIKSHERKTL
jgi:hypothetical protein